MTVEVDLQGVADVPVCLDFLPLASVAGVDFALGQDALDLLAGGVESAVGESAPSDTHLDRTSATLPIRFVCHPAGKMSRKLS